MTIELYQNKSDAIYLNKSINYYATITGTLRDACNLLNPIILFEYSEGDKIWFDIVDGDNDELEDDLGVFNEYNILDANYCYIREFNRYYYITNITIISNKVYSLSMSVDILMSYKDKILDLDAYVSRNEFTYDSYVKDELVSYYYDKTIVELQLPMGDKVNTRLDKIVDNTSYNFMITAINKVHTTTGDTIEPPSIYLPRVQPIKSGYLVSSYNYISTLDDVTTLVRDLIDDDVNATYLLSITAYPFEFKKYDNRSDFSLWLGDTEYSDVKVNIPNTQISDYYVIADFTYKGPNKSFLDYEPFSEYELYIPYLSWIKISADLLLNNRIIVYYVLNYQDATAQVNVFDMTHNKIIYTGNCQLGCKIPINTTNAREVADARNSNNIGLSVGLLTSLLSTGAGIATNNPYALATGLISTGKTIASYVQNSNTNYQQASGNIADGYSGLYLSQYVKLRRTYYRPKDYDANWFKLNGKPLNKYVKLSNLKGYTKIGDVHLSNWTATLDEQELVRQLLFNGIVI